MIITHQKYIKENFEKELRSDEDFFGFSPESKEKEQFVRKTERLFDKAQQVARIRSDEKVGMDCVQSYVSNMSTASSLEELQQTQGFTLPENLMSAFDNEWTAPKWAKAGDIVFFMHSKTARSTITKLRSELIRKRDGISTADYDRLMGYIGHALDIHAKYGGKIFAVGRICGGPEYVQPEDVVNEVLHWKSRNYSAIDNIHVLEHPVDISVFRDYIHISRGSSITPLFDTNFDKLRVDIGKENELPEYVMNSVARPIPLRLINDKNWIEIANDYRRCFILEEQFRKFYVDYLLRTIGDQKRFYTECRCQRSLMNDSFMDYVIRFEGKYLPVEVKLSVHAEPNLIGQVSKYVYNSKVFLECDGSRWITGDSFHVGKVLIIDTEKLYMFEAAKNRVDEIMTLDQVASEKDLISVRKTIIEHL